MYILVKNQNLLNCIEGYILKLYKILVQPLVKRGSKLLAWVERKISTRGDRSDDIKTLSCI
jgi:hypothetical protein